MNEKAKLRALYFFFFGGVGAYVPFFAPYLRGLGWSGEQIGRAQMMGTLAAAPAGLVWATLADRRGTVTMALKITILWSLAVLAFLPWARAPFSVAVLLFMNGCAAPAVGPLADAVTVETLRQKGSHGSTYTRVRLFGSLGYILVAQLLGLALTLRGERAADVAVPLTLVLCTGVAGAVALTLPRLSPAVRSPGATDRAWRIDGNLLLLFVAALLHSASTTPYYQLFGVLVRDKNLPSMVTALAMVVGVLAEVVAMLSFSAFERR